MQTPAGRKKKERGKTVALAPPSAEKGRRDYSSTRRLKKKVGSKKKR